MAFPKGYRLIGGMYYRNEDRSGPYIIAPDGTATLMLSGGSGTSFNPTLQRAMPNEGGTIVVNQTDPVVTLLIEGQAPLSALTIQLPQPGFSQPGQIVRIVAWVDIQAVNYGNANVNGADTQLYSGDGIAIQNIEDNQWLVLP